MAHARPASPARGIRPLILLAAGPGADARWLASVRQRLRREGAQVIAAPMRTADRIAALASDQGASAIVLATPDTDAPRRRQAMERALRGRGACAIPVLVYTGRAGRGPASTAEYRSVTAILRRLCPPAIVRATGDADDDEPGGERPCQLRIED